MMAKSRDLIQSREGSLAHYEREMMMMYSCLRSTLSVHVDGGTKKKS